MKRCPWCGKEAKRRKRGRCPHCNNLVKISGGKWHKDFPRHDLKLVYQHAGVDITTREGWTKARQARALLGRLEGDVALAIAVLDEAGGDPKIALAKLDSILSTLRDKEERRRRELHKDLREAQALVINWGLPVQVVLQRFPRLKEMPMVVKALREARARR